MDDFTRKMPPFTANEKETLAAYLDYQRATLLMKVEGLSDEDVRRRMVPSGLSLLGLVKHLADVEWWWFQDVFAGQGTGNSDTEYDVNAAFRIAPDETTTDLLNRYKAAVVKAREIVAAASLDDRASNPPPWVEEECTLRWIMIYMLEEVARHNGHADLIREMIDGATGE